MIARGCQHELDVDKEAGRDDTDQILIDLKLLVLAGDKPCWFFTDSQIVIDNETSEEYCVCNFEFGWMLSKRLEDLLGHSFYVRSSIGIGEGRPTNGA